MSITTTLLLFYTNIFQSKAANYPCQWQTANSTFDLCRLQLTTSENEDNLAYYEVFDDREDVFFNFTYIFNVCNDIESHPPEESCWNNTLRNVYMPNGYCTLRNKTESSYGKCIEISEITSNVAAYQIYSTSGRENYAPDCYRLHNGIDAPIFSYINSNDPSMGVRLTYINGDWCEVALMNRKFTLEFYCTENAENIPDKKDLIIYEDEICSYILPVSTFYGCPTECPISKNNKLCDGHGICAFDYTNNRSQCYCYYGYCGTDCSSKNCDQNSQQLYNITAPNDDKTCLFELKDSFGVTGYYDLSHFNLENENVIVYDALNRQYKYQFNICGNLENFHDENEIPKSCTNYNHGACTHFESWNCTNQYDTFDNNSTAKAVQIFYPKTNKSYPTCYWLGMDLPSEYNMLSYDIELIDVNDAGKGIIYKILNGEYCDEGARNRQLNVMLRCPDTRGYEFDPYFEATRIINESVFELDTCVYIIEYESPLACPMQCISKGTSVNNNKYSVCSSHGICVSDPQAQQIRCICDGGYTGIQCQKKSVSLTNKPTTSPTNKPTTSPSENPTENPTISPSKLVPISGGNNGGDNGSNNGLLIGLCIGISLLVLIVAGAFFYSQRKKRMEVERMAYNLQDDGQ